MAAGPGSTDAENGVKMAGRDRFRANPPAPSAGVPEQPQDAGAAEQENAAAPGGDAEPQAGAGAGTQARPGLEGRLEVYGDSAYGSGEARAAYRDGGHDTFIKPGPLRPAVPGGFTIDLFTVDEEQGTVTCPAGEPGPDRHLRRGVRRLPAAPAVHYCEGWPVDDHPPA